MRLLPALLAVTPLFAQYSAPVPIFSKLFGGSAGADAAAAPAVDPNGNVAVIGTTDSPDFPVTSGAYLPNSSTPPLNAFTATGVSHPSIGAVSIAALAASSDDSMLYASSASGIYLSTNQGATWTRQNSLLAGANSLAVDGSNPSIVYASVVGTLPPGSPNGIFKSTDGGVTWTQSSTRTGTLYTPTQLSGVVYLFNGGIFISTDEAGTWSPNLAPHNYNVFAMALAPSDPKVVYTVASDGNLYKSSDGGNTWTEPGGMFTAFPANGTLYIVALAVTNTNENTLWADQESGGLSESTDGGVTFTPIAQLSPYVVSVSVNGQNIVVLGQDYGDVSFNGGSSWQQETGYEAALALPNSILVGGYAEPQLFLTKWNSNGSTMLFSTFLPSNPSGQAPPIVSDSSGDTWIASTSLLEFDPSGKLLVSQSLGSFTGRAIAMDSSGNVYVAADYYNGSAGNCTTPAVQNGAIPVLMKFSPLGSLVYSNPLPQLCPAVVHGIAADSSGAVYVTGSITSTSLVTTPTALQPNAPAPSSSLLIPSVGFLAIVAPSGADLSYLSYLGGGQSAAYGVTTDSNGNVYVTGTSNGSSFPFTPTASFGACQQAPTANAFAFVIKLNPASSTPLWTTDLNGACTDSSRGAQISLDSAGNVWVGGLTSSGFFPTLAPFEVQGQDEGFVSEISPNGATLLLSSYAPGPFALGPGNTLYVVGAESPNPPKGAVAIPGAPSLGGAATSALIESFSLSGSQASVIDSIPSLLPTNGDPDSEVLGFAPGELIQISGRGLGPSAAVGAKIGADGRVTTSLAGVSVLFNGVPAPLLSVQESSITCMAPFELDSQTTALIQIQQSNGTTPGVLAGVKPVTVDPEVLAVVNLDGTLNSQSNPAHSGDPLILYVSGFGETNPSVPDGSVYQSALPVPIYSLSGFGLGIAYAGPAPGMVAGIWQVNVTGLHGGSPDSVGLTSSYMIGPYQVSVAFSAWVGP